MKEWSSRLAAGRPETILNSAEERLHFVGVGDIGTDCPGGSPGGGNGRDDGGRGVAIRPVDERHRRPQRGDQGGDGGPDTPGRPGDNDGYGAKRSLVSHPRSLASDVPGHMMADQWSYAMGRRSSTGPVHRSGPL